MTAPPIQATIDDLISVTFPTNICSILHQRYEMLDLGLTVVDRMPSQDDPNYTVGIVPVVRTPLRETTEIRGPNSFVGPTVAEYLNVVYAFVKDANRERGSAAHSVLAEIVEHIVEDDRATKAALGMLRATVMGTTKRMGRHYIRQTRYLANEVGGDHLFLSATEVICEVEKV